MKNRCTQLSHFVSTIQVSLQQLLWCTIVELLARFGIDFIGKPDGLLIGIIVNRTPFGDKFAQNAVGSLIDWPLPGRIDLSVKGFKSGEGGKFIPVVRSNATKTGKIYPIFLFALFHCNGNTGGCFAVYPDVKIVAGQ